VIQNKSIKKINRRNQLTSSIEELNRRNQSKKSIEEINRRNQSKKSIEEINRRKITKPALRTGSSPGGSDHLVFSLFRVELDISFFNQEFKVFKAHTGVFLKFFPGCTVFLANLVLVFCQLDVLQPIEV